MAVEERDAVRESVRLAELVPVTERVCVVVGVGGGVIVRVVVAEIDRDCVDVAETVGVEVIVRDKVAEGEALCDGVGDDVAVTV